MRFVWLMLGWVQVAAGFGVEYFGYHARYVHREYNNVTGLMAEGILSLGLDWLTFLFFTPLGWLALWLIGEGLLRVLSAAMDQSFTTLPYVAGRALHRRLTKKPPPPPDILRADGDGFILDSAYDYDWDALTTLEVDGACFAVTREEPQPLRPHRYRLRPVPPEHVIRKLTRYPADVPPPKPD